MALTKRKILIADDDRALVGVLSVRLAAAGYEVVSATDTRVALEQITSNRPDLIVMDIHMPSGSGFNVLERMYKIPELKKVPVICVSGDISQSVEATAKHFGAFALVRKPFEMDELLGVIAGALKEQPVHGPARDRIL